MTKTTCLVLDKSDFTRDGNIKSETFESIIAADVVVHGNRVVKNNLKSLDGPAPQEFLALDASPTAIKPDATPPASASCESPAVADS